MSFVSGRASIIQSAVRRLRDGGLVAFPTETVYGLGADAFNTQAIERVFALKGRPARNPLIVHVADEAMARTVVAQWPPIAQQLALAFWPGPLSLVLPKSSAVPPIITGGGPNVALRCPNHPLTLELLRQFGRPLVGPSANLSGSISPTTADHVSLTFTPHDVLVLDGGPCRGGIESTVLLLTEHPPRILRPGLISAEQITSITRTPIADFIPGLQAQDDIRDASPLASPGLLERHYAPATPARLIDAPQLAPALRTASTSNQRCIVLTHLPVPVPPPHRVEPLPHDARGYAAALYAALRSADEQDADEILILRPTTPETSKDPAIWLAILDRMHRATVRNRD